MILPENLDLSYYELILTENCNLRCKYCFDDYYHDRNEKCDDSKQTIMKESMIDDLINFIDKTLTKDVNRDICFNFFGGEPMMNWSFIEKFVSIIEEKFSKRKYSFSINTNGTFLNTEKIDYMIKHRFSVGISIDGRRDSHDKNRIDINQKGSWDDTIRKSPELISKSTYGRVNGLMTVSHNNYMDIESNYIFLLNLGVTPNLLFNYDYDISNHQLEVIYNQLNFCFVPKSTVSISPDGKLFFCHQLVPKMIDVHDDNFYGDIINGYTNLEFYNKVTNRTTFNEYKKNSICDNCISNYWCKGGCMSSHFHKYKNFDEINITQCKIHGILTKIGNLIQEKKC